MGHREDLLAGAVRCLREKGYAHTTARDIVAASGTNLASIGYHYGSTKALLNAAVLAAMDEFGEEMARAIGEPDPGPSALEPSRLEPSRLEQSALERFERFWTRVIDSFQASSQVWLATFDIFTVAQRDPEVRAAVAEGLEDGRKLWARLLYRVDDADEETTRAIGSLHQALVSGVLVQWLIDPGRAPSPAELALGLQAIADQVAPAG
jgi:AcrR family transcriptional regulator